MLEAKELFMISPSILDELQTESRRRMGRFKLSLVNLHSQLRQKLTHVQTSSKLASGGNSPVIPTLSQDAQINAPMPIAPHYVRLMTVSPLHWERPLTSQSSTPSLMMAKVNTNVSERPRSETPSEDKELILKVIQVKQEYLTILSRINSKCKNRLVDRKEYVDTSRIGRRARTACSDCLHRGIRRMSSRLFRAVAVINSFDDLDLEGLESFAEAQIKALEKRCDKILVEWKELLRSQRRHPLNLVIHIARGQAKIRNKIDEIKEHALNWMNWVVETEFSFEKSSLEGFDSCFEEAMHGQLQYFEKVVDEHKPSVAEADCCGVATHTAIAVVTMLHRKFLSCSRTSQKAREYYFSRALRRAIELLNEMPGLCKEADKASENESGRYEDKDAWNENEYTDVKDEHKDLSNNPCNPSAFLYQNEAGEFVEFEEVIPTAPENLSSQALQAVSDVWFGDDWAVNPSWQ